MLRNSFKRIIQLAGSNFPGTAASALDSAASSPLAKDAVRSWTQATNYGWSQYGMRLYSTGTEGDGPTEGNDTSSKEGTHPVPTSPPPAAQVSPLSMSNEEAEAALEAWGNAMDRGDWDAAWDIFETRFPVDGPEFPELEELLAWDPDADDKAMRRQREEALQEEVQAARVRKVGGQGRSHAVGKRKTSIARVWIRQGPGHIMINKRPYDAYLQSLPRRNDMLAPFFITDTLGKFDVMAAVQGGGPMGQAQALRHGIARALQNWDPELRPALKDAGLLTRDARIVERKKPGRKKARKAFQWVKR